MTQAPLQWDQLTFALTPTAEQYTSHYDPVNGWDAGNFSPFADFALSPAATVLNYGQGIFEGMKALSTQNGDIHLFRPSMNSQRMAHGATRFCMPVFPEDRFLAAVKTLVLKNRDYIPPYGLGSLYIRPTLWGTTAALGVKAAQHYMFNIYASPVGAYYQHDSKGIDIIVCDTAHRAAPKGCGDIKCIGNYAGVLWAKQAAHAQGYADCIFLDAKLDCYIEEASSSNFFAVFGKNLVTPQLGSILPGITRASILTIASQQLGLHAVERHLSVAEALTADEVFLTGTAAVVTPVASLTVHRTTKQYGDGKPGPVTQQISERLQAIQVGNYPDQFDWVVKVI